MITLIGFVIISCLIVLVIIILRQIPVLARLTDQEMAILSQGKGFVQRWRGSGNKQWWLGLMLWLEKFLRRARLWFLKIENLLEQWIRGLRAKSQAMTQKSKNWIKQKELKKIKFCKEKFNPATEIKKPTIETEPQKESESEPITPPTERKERSLIEEEIKKDESPEVRQILQINSLANLIPISELKKPTQEEQKWIDLIVVNPKNISAYKALGVIYWRQHNYADAKASLEAAVRLGSKDKKVIQVLEELKEMESQKLPTDR